MYNLDDLIGFTLYTVGGYGTGTPITNGQGSGYFSTYQRNNYVMTVEDGYTVETEPYVIGHSGIRHDFIYNETEDYYELSNVLMSDLFNSSGSRLTAYFHGLAEGEEVEPVITVEIETEIESVPFDVITTEDSEMLVGESVVTQEGVLGESTVEYEVTYTDGVETERVEISRTVTLEPVDEHVTIGTKEPEIPVEYKMLNLFSNPQELENPNYVIRIDGELIPYDTETQTYPPVPIIKGTQVNLTITAKSHRILPENIEVFEKDELGSWRRVHTFATDGRTGGFRLTMSGDKDMRFNFITTIAPRPDVEDFPFVKIYEIDRDNLELLTTIDFEDTQNSGYWLVTKGGSEYMMALYRVPFIIEGDEPENVLLGEYETNIPAQSIGTHVYTIDLGQMYVGLQVWGGVSYSNVTVELFVPYFKKIELDVDEVMMNTISVSIELNLLNGTGTLNVYSEKTNSVIYSENKQISQYIPYIMGDTIKSEMGTDVLETTITKPYLEIKKEIPNNEVSMESIRSLEVDSQQNIGFLQIDNLYLTNTSATNKERAEIKRLLSEGVYTDV